MARNRSDWPIIIGGYFRSGTSLLRRVLNAHPSIHCGPEVKFFRDFHSDYQSDPLRHLRFFTTARSLAPEKELLGLFGSAFVSLHEEAAARSRKRRWADKNPENVLYLKLWDDLLDQKCLVVNMVRDPLDVVASLRDHPFPLSVPPTMEGRVDDWRRYVEAGLAHQQQHPDRVYLLRYERLVSDPEPELSRLMSWLEEDFIDDLLQFHLKDHELGLEDPKVSKTEGIHTRSIGRWQEVLGSDEVGTVRDGTSSLFAEVVARGTERGR